METLKLPIKTINAEELSSTTFDDIMAFVDADYALAA